MKKVNYYCDCCGREVSNESDLTLIEIFSDFKHMQDNPHPYDLKDLCKKCQNEIKQAIYDKFHEISARKGENK